MRTPTPSGFHSAVLRALRNRYGIDDITARTLESWQGWGGLDSPTVPRVRGFRPDYAAPADYVARVVEMRQLIREEKCSRALAVLRLLARHGEKAAPERARELAAARSELLEQAEALEQRVADAERELAEAVRNGASTGYGPAVYRVLDHAGRVLIGRRREDTADGFHALELERERAGSCTACGKDVFLNRSGGVKEALEAGTPLLCSSCAYSLHA